MEGKTPSLAPSSHLHRCRSCNQANSPHSAIVSSNALLSQRAGRKRAWAPVYGASPRRHPPGEPASTSPHLHHYSARQEHPPSLPRPAATRRGVPRPTRRQYPDATIERLSDDALPLPPGDCAWSMDLCLRPDIFPLRRYAQFEDPLNRNTADPLTALFAAFAVDLPGACPARIEITIRPAGRRQAVRARQTLRLLTHPFFQSRPTVARAYALAATSSSLSIRHAAFAVGTVMRSGSPPRSASSTRTHDREDHHQAAADKLGRHLFEGHIRLLAFAPPTARDRAHAQLAWLAGAFGPFTMPHLARFQPSHIRQHIAAAPPPRHRGFLLSCEEVATLWHPATSTVRAPPWPSPPAASWNRPSCCRRRSRNRDSLSSAGRSFACAGRSSACAPTTAAGTWPSSARPAWGRRRCSTSSSHPTSGPAGGWRSSIRTATSAMQFSPACRRIAPTTSSSSTWATGRFRSPSIPLRAGTSSNVRL